ncbi:MAG: 16S rRNA (adenine(1518)-N(6)/adenine(1519)-N(6))-dimethyltransferase RsmA, partial [bacterium]
QHWLSDHKYLVRISDVLEAEHDETCIEIGGGKGALTRIISPNFKKVIVYEIDRKWAEHLREFKANWKGEIEVRQKDALLIEWNRESLGLSHSEPLVITGNLPYYITSPLLLRLAYGEINFRRTVFLIQKEVAQKISSKPGDSEYGRLTVSLGAFLKSELLFDIPPDAFKPPPKVMSSVIRFTRHKNPKIKTELAAAFEKTVQAAFHMRRKTIKNNITKAYPRIPQDKLIEIFQNAGIEPGSRAQESSVEKFIALTKLLNE